MNKRLLFVELLLIWVLKWLFRKEQLLCLIYMGSELVCMKCWRENRLFIRRIYLLCISLLRTLLWSIRDIFRRIRRNFWRNYWKKTLVKDWGIMGFRKLRMMCILKILILRRLSRRGMTLLFWILRMMWMKLIYRYLILRNPFLRIRIIMNRIKGLIG